MPLSSVTPRSEDDEAVGTSDVLSRLASDRLTTVLVEDADTVVHNAQAIRDPSQRTDDGDLIYPQTTLNVTEAHNFDASHSTFIQGNQTNVFSKTTNTYINTRAWSLFRRLKLVCHHIDASPGFFRRQTRKDSSVAVSYDPVCEFRRGPRETA